jgi:hypothetical protein
MMRVRGSVLFRFSWATLRPVRSYTQSVAAAAYTGSSTPGTIKVPQRVEDIEATNAVEFGAELHADHPGFRDQEYRARRKMITDLVSQHRRMYVVAAKKKKKKTTTKSR